MKNNKDNILHRIKYIKNVTRMYDWWMKGLPYKKMKKKKEKNVLKASE